MSLENGSIPLLQTPALLKYESSLSASREAEIIKEVEVFQKVAKMQNEGTWKRLKPYPTPAVPKSHWGYLIDEMRWMHRMYQNEKNFRLKNTKKLNSGMKNYFKILDQNSSKKLKEEESVRRKNALVISNAVKQFWSNVYKIAWYKAHVICNLSKRRAFDERLNKVIRRAKPPEVRLDSGLLTLEESLEDNDFNPTKFDASDVEDTIEVEESLGKSTAKEYADEINDLESENNMEYEQLLEKYRDYLQNNGAPTPVSDDEETKPDVKNHVPAKISKRKRRKNGKRGSKRRKKSECYENGNDSSVIASDPTRSEESKDFSLEAEQNGDVYSDDFQPEGTLTTTAEVTTKIPYLLHHKLREYQHVGLDWLVSLYNDDRNGILADEMGLGKTIQTIALLAHLAVEEGNWGPFLIIVPSSLILNWELEIYKWCPGFKVLTYYGSSKERKLKRSGWYTQNSFHVCITSYTVAIQDHMCFRRRQWEYMILDEAHHIKNFKSRRWQVLLNFNTKRRLLLTGTPLQNNLMELWSLLHFLMPEVFESHSEFKEWFSKPMAEIANGSREFNENIVKQLHKTLRPFILRRLKSEVEKQMPKKVEHVIKCPLSKRQRFLYEEFVSRTDTKNALSGGGFLNMLNVLMQLRKVCNHPNLFEPRQIVSPFLMEGVNCKFPSLVWDLVPNERVSLYGNWDSVPVNYDLVYEDKVKKREVMNLITGRKGVNVFMDPIDSPPRPNIKLEPYWYTRGSHGTLALKFVDELETSSDSGDDDSRSYGSENLSQTGYDNAVVSRIQSRNLNSSFKPWNETALGKILNIQDFLLDDIEDKKRSDKISAVETMNEINYRRCSQSSLINFNLINACQMIAQGPPRGWRKEPKKKNTNSFSSGDGYAAIMTLMQSAQDPGWIHHPFFLWKLTQALAGLVHVSPIDLFQFVVFNTIFVIPIVSLGKHPEENMYVAPNAALEYRRVRHIDNLRRQIAKPFWPLHPVVRNMAAVFPDSRLVQHDCGKLQVLDRLLRKLKENHKVLIFTQMSKMLDILETFLTYHGHAYLRLDGSTKVDKRQMLVERFNKDPKVFCFILSTRAGGLGINLTGADTVIFYDSDWNPTMDAQAQDRCHRIGQTRDVHIYRLIGENSVEENILKTSNQKRLLGEHAIEDGRFNLGYFTQHSIRQMLNLDIKSDEQHENEKFINQSVFEGALAEVEDDIDDKKAMESALREVDADEIEFSEEGDVCNLDEDFERNKMEFMQLFEMLTPIECYALSQVDQEIQNWSDDYIVTFMDEIVVDNSSDSESHHSGMLGTPRSGTPDLSIVKIEPGF